MRTAALTQFIGTFRFSRLLVSVIAMVFCFSGERPLVAAAELSETELSARLKVKGSSLDQFVTRLETEITRGDMAWAEGIVDREAILDRATSAGEDAAEVRQIFTEGTRKAWEEKGLLNEYQGTNFRFLRSRSFARRPGLLFRSSGENGSLNYCMLTIAEPLPGEFRITDIYVLGVNEFMSDTLGRTWGHLVASLGGHDSTSPYVQNLTRIANISGLVRDQQWKEAIDACKALPPDLRHDRNVMLLRIEAAEKYSIAERSEALTEWIQAIPDEMELPLKFVDHYTATERWDDAERVINGLMMRIGEDSRLNFQLGDVQWKRRQQMHWVEAAALQNSSSSPAAKAEKSE